VRVAALLRRRRYRDRGKSGDDRSPDGIRDLLDTAQVALRRCREAGFDDVHAEHVELASQSQLAFR
jgi:hypothetical protein